MKIKWLLTINLIALHLLFSQTTEVQFKATQEILNQYDHKEILSVQINKPQQNGFFIEWNQVSDIVPTRIVLSGNTLWLKQSNQIPARQDQVHWQVKDNRLQLLFAPGELRSGRQIEIELNVFNSKPDAASLEILLFSLSGNAQGGFVHKTLLDRTHPVLLKQ